MRQTRRKPGPAEPVTTTKKRLRFIPGQLIVRVKEEAVKPALAGRVLKLAPKETERLPESVTKPLDFLRRNAGLKEMRPIFSSRNLAHIQTTYRPATRHKLAVMSSVADSVNEDLAGISLAIVDKGSVTKDLVKTMMGAQAIEFVEPVAARWLSATRVDPMQNMQWGLRAINWFRAKLPDAGHVKVGILDSGIDADHPDLVEAVESYDHIGFKKHDIIGHGTHVAGIIAAGINNSVGVSGVANCRLAVWKVFPDQPDVDGEFYVDMERSLWALNEARRLGVQVLNLSLGGTASQRTEELVLRKLIASGTVVVAAMGNEYEEGNPVEYPAAYENVMAVGAIRENRERASFSNTGRHIHIMAPGVAVLSTLPMKASKYRKERKYEAWEGTSMATPFVSAAAALLCAKHRAWSPAQIRRRLTSSAARLSAMGKRPWTAEYGYGLLNLRNALV